MSATVVVLLVLAGLSETAGRVLPLVARRPRLSPPLVAGLMITGTMVEGAMIAVWPVASWAVADLAQPLVAPGVAELPATTGLRWTPALLTPLLLAAVLAFPLLGPALHLLLVIGVGAGLAGALAAASGLGWWAAACCVTVAAVGLTATVEAVRRVVAWMVAGAREREVVA